MVTAPLIAAISGRISVVSIVANVAVTALIPPITVAGTAAAALAPLWPGAAHLLIRFTGPELWWLLNIARWAGGVPGATVEVPSRLPGMVLVAAGALGTVLLWRLVARARERRRPPMARSSSEL